MRGACFLLLSTVLVRISSGFAQAPATCVVEPVAVAPGTVQFQFNGLSPDGRLLGVGWEREQSHGAYVLDLQSRTRTDLPPAFDNAVSFSPDGRLIVSAARVPEKRTEIIEMTRANGTMRVIASDPAAEFLPSYSHDMSRVYFNSYRTGGSDLYVADRATGVVTRLTSDDRYEAHAQLSPNGTALAFHRRIDLDDYDVVVLDLPSGRERVLARTPGEDAYPAWSPDGAYIVFSSDRAAGKNHLDLFVMRADGSDVRPLTSGGNDSYATWAADGRAIYYVSRHDGHGVYRVRLDPARGCGPTVKPRRPRAR